MAVCVDVFCLSSRTSRGRMAARLLHDQFGRTPKCPAELASCRSPRSSDDHCRSGSISGRSGSEGPDPLGLQALGALGDVKLDPLVLLQAAEAAGLDGREVDENVLVAAVDVDESEALVRVEPLHSSLCHGVSPLPCDEVCGP